MERLTDEIMAEVLLQEVKTRLFPQRAPRQMQKKKDRSWELEETEGEVKLNQVDDQIKVLDNILDELKTQHNQEQQQEEV